MRPNPSLKRSGNAFIAPGQVGVELGPLRLGAMQRHAGDAAEFVAAVFQHIRQGQAQDFSFQHGFQIDFQNQSWHFDAVAREWEVPSYSNRADVPTCTSLMSTVKP